MLKDDGLYLALVIDKLRGGLFIPSYTRTVKEVFPYVYILNDAPSWQSPFPNTYLVAASATPIDMDRIQGRSRPARARTAARWCRSCRRT